MKKIILSLAVLLSVTIAKAQEDQEKPSEIRTLFGGVSSHGFYGALSAGYTSIDSRDAIVMGGRAAWIMNHRLAIGFGGNAFVTQPKYDNILGSDANFAGGYGGVFFEPILFPESPVHISIPVMVGAGGVGYAKHTQFDEWDDDDDYHHYRMEDGDPFVFVKPGIELELNVVKFMRFSVGAYYMQTSNVNLSQASSGFLNGFSGMMTFKFGKF